MSRARYAATAFTRDGLPVRIVPNPEITLPHVRPCSAQDGQPHRLFRDVKLGSERRDGHTPRNVPLPCLSNDGVSQFRQRATLASGDAFWMIAVAVFHQPLLSRVGHVVGVRSGEQVAGIAARLVVARVANLQAIGDRTVGQLIRDAVGSDDLAVTVDATVSGRRAPGAVARPTDIWPAGLVNARPQAALKGARVAATAGAELSASGSNTCGLLSERGAARRTGTLNAHRVLPHSVLGPRSVVSRRGLRRANYTRSEVV